MPDAYAPATTPEVSELDELETFVAFKKQEVAVNDGWPLPTGNLGLGAWRSQYRNLPATLDISRPLAMHFYVTVGIASLVPLGLLPVLFQRSRLARYQNSVKQSLEMTDLEETAVEVLVKERPSSLRVLRLNNNNIKKYLSVSIEGISSKTIHCWKRFSSYL